MKISFITSFIFLLCASCSSIQTRQDYSIQFQDIEKLKLGTEQSQILNSLGPPNEKSEIKEKGEHYSIWQYWISPKDGRERASLSLDPASNTLIDKLFRVREGDPERKLNYMLRVKYVNFEFQKIYFPICNRHYASTDALLINVDHGIIIRYWKRSGNVIAVGWTSPAKAKDEINKIKNCVPRSNYL